MGSSSFSRVSFQLLDHRDFITPDGALYIDMLFSTEDPVLDPVGNKIPWIFQLGEQWRCPSLRT